MKEPFEIWWGENMGGFGVSDELKKLLAKAFAGGMEASSGMKSVSVKKISYINLMRHIKSGDFDPYQVGEPEFVAIWPLPPSMAEDEPARAMLPRRPPEPSPTERLKSFMGDVAWGDEPKSVPLSKTMYDPSTDTWHTRTGSTDRIVGAEVWHTAETYADMSREEREREMAVIADMLKKKIDESVLDKVRGSVGMTTGGMITGLIPPKHLYDHMDFVASMSHPKKILTDEQRKTLAMKKKEMSDHINKLAKKHKARK